MRNLSIAELWRNKRRMGLLLIYGIITAAIGAGAMYGIGRGLLLNAKGPPADADHDAHEEDGDGEGHAEHGKHGEHEGEAAGTFHVPEEKQTTAGIRVEPAYRGDFTTSVRVTGKVALNEDRVTHIHPLVEGRVHEVNVPFGARVKAGQVLAVIDSQQVGRAKLELYQRMLETRLAKVNHDWQHEIAENAQALIGELEKGVPIADIEQRFPDKPMGEFREQLLSAYAGLYKARADYKRLKELSEQGVTAGRRFIDAEAARDAAQAVFSGTLEQIKFTAQRNELAAEQEVEKAQTAEAISRENLAILGYRDVNKEAVDPAQQGEAISHYEAKAPFDGTVISRDTVLLEQVDPSTQLFAIADFSTVWLRADIYENYLPLLNSLAGKTIQFRADSYPDRVFEATVFYTGDIVDEKTRKADMRAIAQNPDGLLKPGMFVEIELPGDAVADAVQIPRAAVAEEKGETFVFVQKSEEEFERRDVVVGRAAGDVLEIVEGLEAGEPVAVSGLFSLKTAAGGEVAHAHVH